MRFAGSLALLAGTLAAADTVEVFGSKWQVPFGSEWKVERQGGVSVLRMLAARPQETPRRPIQFALSDQAYQRVTIDAEVKPLGSSLIIVFAYRDQAHFNYAHLSTDRAADQPVHNGIFHVYGGERVRISPERGPAAFAQSGRWYRVRLTHDATTGIAEVGVNGRPVLALTAVDLSLGAGRIGLGSFFETAEFRNVRITGARAARSRRAPEPDDMPAATEQPAR